MLKIQTISIIWQNPLKVQLSNLISFVFVDINRVGTQTEV